MLRLSEVPLKARSILTASAVVLGVLAWCSGAVAAELPRFDVPAACKADAQKRFSSHPEVIPKWREACGRSQDLAKGVLTEMLRAPWKPFELEFCRAKAVDEQGAYLSMLGCLQELAIGRQRDQIRDATVRVLTYGRPAELEAELELLGPRPALWPDDALKECLAALKATPEQHYSDLLSCLTSRQSQ